MLPLISRKDSCLAITIFRMLFIVRFDVLFVFTLCVHHRFDLDGQTEEIDKSLRIHLVVYVVFRKSSDILVVKRIRTGNSRVGDIALVKFELDVAGDSLLSAVYECAERFSERSKPLTVVYEICEFYGNQLLVVRQSVSSTS